MTDREKMFWVVGHGRGDVVPTLLGLCTIFTDITEENFDEKYQHYRGLLLECSKEIRDATPDKIPV